LDFEGEEQRPADIPYLLFRCRPLCLDLEPPEAEEVSDRVKREARCSFELTQVLAGDGDLVSPVGGFNEISIGVESINPVLIGTRKSIPIQLIERSGGSILSGLRNLSEGAAGLLGAILCARSSSTSFPESSIGGGAGGRSESCVDVLSLCGVCPKGPRMCHMVSRTVTSENMTVSATVSPLFSRHLPLSPGIDRVVGSTG
jgi:hypothetical protein